MEEKLNCVLNLVTVAEFRWFSNRVSWFLNTLRYYTEFHLFKDMDNSSWLRNGSH